jgi:hypothetical protein
MLPKNTMLALVVALAVEQGCRSALQGSASSPHDAYYEDLSALRPPVNRSESREESRQVEPVKRDTDKYMEPKHTVNIRVDMVLDSIDRFHLTRGYADGYTIQVYAGTRRDEALNVKKNLALYLPQFEAEVQYNQPTFRVKTGRYFSLLEAQKDFLTIKNFFPSAIVVPDKIPLPK